MNQSQRTRRRLWFPILLLTALLGLTACEMPAQRTDPIQVDPSLQQPVTDPNLQPATDPLGQPLAPVDGYPAPGVDAGGVLTPTEQGQGEIIVQPAEGSGEQQPGAGTPGEPAPPADGVHVVQSGETLGLIAQRYGVSIEDIAAANNLVNVDDLDVGQQLTIPAAGFAEQQPAAPAGGETGQEGVGERIHVVQRGDNLYRIGLQYGFTVEELTTYNGLANPNDLDVGQEIRIPPSA